jgi:signal transduction histidine kinase/ligand-binding sensor domain-containing protein
VSTLGHVGKYRLNFLVLILSLICSVGAFGSEHSSWYVRSWQTDDGLPENDVTGIAQDSEGYLWVATQGGLASFDGIRFRDIPLSIPSQRTRPLIRLMILGHDNEQWLAIEGGIVISLAPGHTNVFTTADGLPLFRPLSLAQARDGAIWVGYADGSACRIAAGKVTRLMGHSGLSGTGVCVLACDIQGRIWLAKSGILYIYRDDGFVPLATVPDQRVHLAAARDGGLWIGAGTNLLQVQEGKPPELVASIPAGTLGITPSVLFEDRSGAVWFGTLVGGLFRISGTNVTAVATPNPDILSLTEDREGSIWVGTGGGGLGRLRVRVMELENKESGLPFSNVRSVCEDASHVLWAATQSGELARRVDNHWQNVSSGKGWPGKRVTCVTPDGQGGIWVGTSHEGLLHWQEGRVSVLKRGDGLGGDIIRGLLVDRNTNLWIALDAPSRIQCYRQGQFQTFALPAGVRTVRAMAQDRSGTIWLGTLDGHLLRVQGDQLVDAMPEVLPRASPIRCLYADGDGDLWIGYAGGGVGRIHAGKFSSLNSSRGLYDNYICAMMEDEGGGFWFSSDHGIFQVRRHELDKAMTDPGISMHSVVYGRDELLSGLQGNYGYWPNSVRGEDGRVWFPTRAGLVGINPGISAPSHIAPPVVIEQALVDAKPLSLVRGGTLKLPPGFRKLQIDFTALSFIAPENCSFRCRLKGWDGEWEDIPPNQRSITYTRLPAGEYVFQVIACNSAGVWNETGSTLKFSVTPFLWQRSWFQLISLVALVAGVVAVVRYVSYRRYRTRLQQMEQEAVLQKERARIARDIHDELGANLTQISLLGKFAEHDLAEPAKAGMHIKKISDIARQGGKSVDEIVWAVNPRNDTLNQLLDYAGQYAVDFLRSADIRCRIDFPEKVPHRELPANLRHGLFMLVKEALNNAVKHSGASEMTLNVQLAHDQLRLTIVDNGHGFSSPKEDALADGLRNMRQRAADLGGRCQIESTPGTGTKVVVELSLP